jgi:hypothetical protein
MDALFELQILQSGRDSAEIKLMHGRYHGDRQDREADPLK